MGLKSRSLHEIADEVVKRLDDPTGRGHDVSNEPRIPKGHGDESGEWTTGSGSADTAPSPNDEQHRYNWPRPYSMCDHGYQGPSCDGWVRSFLDDKPWDYMPTQDDLNSLSDEQKDFYARFYEGLADGTEVLSALQGAGRLYKGIPRWLLGKVGKKALKASPTLGDIAAAYRSGISRRSSPE